MYDNQVVMFALKHVHSRLDQIEELIVNKLTELSETLTEYELASSEDESESEAESDLSSSSDQGYQSAPP